MSYTNGQDNPQLFFQVKLYSGTGSSLALTFDGTEDMQANLVWLKCRSHSGNHFLYDSVRGANRSLVPNDTDAEDTSGESTNYLTSFDSDGITLGGSYNNTNASGRTYLALAWKEASGIFDIVSYTGNGSNRNISHNLSAVPTMMIHKSRDNASYMWGVYHKALGNQKNLNLNSNASQNDDSGGVYYNSTSPTSSVFSLGTNVGYNKNTDDYIAYLFGDRQGICKMFSYSGNGSTNGTYVHLGFSPELIIWKNATTSNLQGWWMVDAKRDTYNVADENLRPSGSGAASESYDMLDFTANGFKVRWDDDAINDSGETFVGMAFAKAPFVNSKGVPANAR